MTRRAFLWVAIAYACLAVGATVSLYLFSKQADDIEAINDRLIGAAIAYCEAGIQPDAKEPVILRELADGTFKGPIHPDCRDIGDRLRDGH